MTAALKVRIGIGLGVQRMIDDHADLRAVCTAVEEVGFDSLWLSEVIASPAPDPVAAIAFAAAVTERVKLGTSILVAPGRPPAMLAKTIATLDLLTGGRFLPILGLGTVDPDEQASFNVTRPDRAPWMDESITILRRLWTEETVTHHGDLFCLDNVGLTLHPHRRLPIWLGGRARTELVRTGKVGDGWLASFATPNEVSNGIDVINESAAAAGRAIDVDHFGVLLLYSLHEVSPATARFLAWRRPDLTIREALPVGAAQIVQRLHEYIDAGASKFVLIPADRPDSWSEELAELGCAVLGMQSMAGAGRAPAQEVAG